MPVNIPGTDIVLKGGGPGSIPWGAGGKSDSDIGPGFAVGGWAQVLANFFGRGNNRFPRRYASQLANLSTEILGRQSGIIAQAGGKDSDVYGRLQDTRGQLSKLINTGNITGIINMQKNLTRSMIEGQEIINPGGGYDYTRQKLPSDFRTRYGGYQDMMQNAMSPFLGMRQALDVLEGIGADKSRTPRPSGGRNYGTNRSKTIYTKRVPTLDLVGIGGRLKGLGEQPPPEIPVEKQVPGNVPGFRGGGTREPVPEPEQGARFRIPWPRRGLPALPSLSFIPGQVGISGTDLSPKSDVGVGDVVGRAANPLAPRGRTDIVENPLSAKNLRKLRDILS